jgi:hypothetical protein
MCFSYKSSLLTFILGTVFSIILIYFGNPKYKLENTLFGIFFIFISSIQFMDFLFWIDLKNKIGFNKIMSIIGPLLNVGQPTILYIIKNLFLKPDLLSLNYINLVILFLNIIYFFILIKNYVTYIIQDKLITSTKHRHLNWPWLNYFNPYYYLFLFGINIFYLTNFKYSLFVFLIVYFLLFLSIKYFNKSIEEIWCFFGSFIPILILITSYNI